MPAAAARPPAGRGRVLLAVLFAIYLVLLAWVVLWKLEVPFAGTGDLRRLKLAPFAAGGGVSANTPVELGINVLLFLPFGVYLGLLADRWPWWKAAGIVAGTSLAFEVTQYVLAIGVADDTDVIVNTAGALAGCWILACVRRGLRESTTAVLVPICVWGTVLALLVVGAFIASPLGYGPHKHSDRSTHQLPMQGSRSGG